MAHREDAATDRTRLRASILALLALLFFALDRRILSLVPGWGVLADALRAANPFLVATLLVLIDSLFAMLCVLLALQSDERVRARETGADGIWRWLGLASSPLPALRLAVLALIPGYLVFALTRPLNGDMAGYGVIYLAFLGPFAEELVYRGVAFGLLRRVAGWPFWAAALLPAAAFGLGHANPFGGTPSLDAAMTFLVTASGAIVFSWLYERWRFDLWVPVFLHAFMNLAWSLFRVGDGAFAGWLPLGVQIASVTLAILLTLRRTRTPRKERPPA